MIKVFLRKSTNQMSSYSRGKDANVHRGYSVSYEAPVVLVNLEDENPWEVIKYAVAINAVRYIGKRRLLVISLLGDPFQADLLSEQEIIGFFEVLIRDQAA